MKRVLSVIFAFVLSMSTFAAKYSYAPEKGVLFSWLYDDPIIVFHGNNPLLKFWATTVNGNATSFSAYGWGLSTESSYVAYSPYDDRSGNTTATALPMTYDGQVQDGNDNMSHIAPYDYMQTQPTAPSGTTLNFNFSHLGAVIRFEIKVPEAIAPKSMALKSGNSEVTIGFENIELQADATLVAYMVVPPMTLDGGKATLTLCDADDRMAEIPVSGSEILAGKCYPVVLECPAFPAGAKAGISPVASSHAKRIADNRPKATAGSIETPTAYAPDFAIDAEHPLSQASNKLLGDVNGDGRVMVNDAVLLINYYLQDAVNELDKDICDVNGDGVINVADAVAIINIYLKSE